MTDTEELTLADIANMNANIRALPVTTADVQEIAAGMNLGIGTVRRWFDATNGGDYSPCIPANAEGKEAYFLLEELSDETPDLSRYPQSPNAFQREEEDTQEEYATGADPAFESMYARILLGSLATDGFEREPSSKSQPANARETFTGRAKSYVDQAASVWQVVELVRETIAGQQGAWHKKAWVSFSADFDAEENIWEITTINQKQDDDDESP